MIGVNNLDDSRVKRRLLGQLSAVPGANLLDNLQVSELVVKLNTDLLLWINMTSGTGVIYSNSDHF